MERKDRGYPSGFTRELDVACKWEDSGMAPGFEPVVMVNKDLPQGTSSVLLCGMKEERGGSPDKSNKLNQQEDSSGPVSLT